MVDETKENIVTHKSLGGLAPTTLCGVNVAWDTRKAWAWYRVTCKACLKARNGKPKSSK